MKEKRFMRIIKAKDIFGKKFIPTYPYYEVIYTNEKFVALGIDGIVMYRIKMENMFLFLMVL